MHNSILYVFASIFHEEDIMHNPRRKETFHNLNHLHSNTTHNLQNTYIFCKRDTTRNEIISQVIASIIQMHTIEYKIKKENLLISIDLQGVNSYTCQNELQILSFSAKDFKSHKLEKRE